MQLPLDRVHGWNVALVQKPLARHRLWLLQQWLTTPVRQGTSLAAGIPLGKKHCAWAVERSAVTTAAPKNAVRRKGRSRAMLAVAFKMSSLASPGGRDRKLRGTVRRVAWATRGFQVSDGPSVGRDPGCEGSFDHPQTSEARRMMA